MGLANFSELKASVASWLMRDDLTAQIPDFITLCETRNNMRLRVREMEATATLTIGSDSTFTLPTDFIEPRRVLSNVDPVSPLFPITLDLASTYSTSGYPYYYAIKGSSLRVYPPNTANITLDYWQAIPALSTGNPTNWLLTKVPAVYLWGTCLMAAPFLEDDNRILTWGNLYEAAVTELMKQNERAVFGKTIARVRGYTP